VADVLRDLAQPVVLQDADMGLTPESMASGPAASRATTALTIALAWRSARA